MKYKYLSVILIVLLSSSLLASCGSSEKKTNSKPKNTTTAITQPKTQSGKNFQSQVQAVCDSVDPQVFSTALAVDPSKDPEIKSKYDSAITSLDSLENGFKVIVPPKGKEKVWESALSSLSQTKSQMKNIQSQYLEYASLNAESQTNKDPARAIQIVSRMVQLAAEYIAALSELNKSFDNMLKMGASAGISRCKAFELPPADASAG